MLRKIYVNSRRFVGFCLYNTAFYIRNLGKRPLPTEIKKILICNPAHVGDVIIATSVLPLLKAHFPGVEIGFLVGSWSECVVLGHPDLARVHIYDHWRFNRGKITKGQKKARHLLTAFQASKEIASFNYDICLDLYHNPCSTVIAAKAKIPYRLGYMRKWGGLFLTHALKWKDKNQPIVKFHLELLELLKISCLSAFPSLPMKAAPKTIPSNGILFHIGTGAEKREWPVSHWRKLAKLCIDAGYHLVFTGQGSRESMQIEKITQGLKNVTNYCDQLNFEEWTALISKAPLLVNVNTSAGHVASAFQIPNIVLFSGIDKQEQWGPFNPKSTLLMKMMPCYPCYRGCKSMSCIREISVEEVFAEILKKR